MSLANVCQIKSSCRWFVAGKTPNISVLRYYRCSTTYFSHGELNLDQTQKPSKAKSTRYRNAVKTLNNWIDKAKTPIVDVESVYKILPKANKYVPKTEIPVPRFIWKEKEWPDGFPPSPEEADVDILTYLEQKDCYKRMKKLKSKEFCVGSYVAVTYADCFATGGSNRFCGICIYKGHWQNSLGASFTLRNVIDNEPLEINFQLYSPLIQEIQVLKHQRFKEHQLKYLRDYPPAFSYVSEKMKEQPYTEEPELFKFSEEHEKKIDRWFARYYQKKRQ